MDSADSRLAGEIVRSSRATDWTSWRWQL